ncbi:MAG: helix-turn-helix domain-containing protein [Phenylobacterium sp.]
MTDAFHWPAATLPRLKLAGQFALADRGFETRYLGPTHALHLHEYTARMRLGAEPIDLRPGDLTLSPAGVETAYDLAAPGRHWCVHFQPAPSEGATVALRRHMRPGPAGAYVAERLSAISRMRARTADVLAQASAAVALQDLLLWCAVRAQPDADAADAVADRVSAIIDARFAEPIDAQRLAREVGRSQNYVARAFRRRFGMTVPSYALRRRVTHAQYLLESTDLPVGVIGRRVGIEDPHYLNKLVRRLLGDSPTALRRRARGPSPHEGR